MPSNPDQKPMRLSPDHLALLSAFNEYCVDYLIVGGHAVGFYSEPRATKDLDLYIRNDEVNSHAVFRALVSFGAPLSGLRPEDFQDGISWYMMGNPPNRVDLLQALSGISFEQAWEGHVLFELEPGLVVHIIALEALIRNKTASGRLRDLADLEDIHDAQQVVRSRFQSRNEE